MKHQHDTGAPPTLSVVMASHGRGPLAVRAARSVLDQVDSPPLELLVVDTSQDDTADRLESIADPRLTVVRTFDRGMPVSRNAGVERARGCWIAFLDDDDVAEPWWGAALLSAADSQVGLVVGGVRRFDGERLIDEFRPLRDSMVSGVPGQFVAGAFMVRAALLRDVGCMLPGLPALHHQELAIRTTRRCHELGLRVAVVDRPVLRVTLRSGSDRPTGGSARELFDGARWVLARHRPVYAADPRWKASVQAVAGVAAGRLGEWSGARRLLFGALRATPTSSRAWGRAALSLLPPAGRRVWRSAPQPVTALARVPGLFAERPQPALAFLPDGYREQEPRSADAAGTPFWADGEESSDDRWQVPVYRLAGRLVRRHGWSPVLDVGCGTGGKLLEHVRPAAHEVVGMDQPSGIAIARSRAPSVRWIEGDLGSPDAWEEARRVRPQLVVCADVIEHLADPFALLHSIGHVLGPAGRLLISTPDRSRLDGAPRLGPPGNPRHVREWSAEEFRLLLEASGFEPLWARHLLPRRYSATRTELNRFVWRSLHRRAVPDRRSCMVVLARPVR